MTSVLARNQFLLSRPLEIRSSFFCNGEGSPPFGIFLTHKKLRNKPCWLTKVLFIQRNKEGKKGGKKGAEASFLLAFSLLKTKISARPVVVLKTRVS